jgi:hypothetical protein
MEKGGDVTSAYDCTGGEAEERVRDICTRYEIPFGCFQAHRIAVESNRSFASAEALAARMQVAWRQYRQGHRKDWWTW